MEASVVVVIGEHELTSVPRARLVLQDALQVRRVLEDATGRIEWRLNWVLEVTLLRAVGHVLRNVDGRNDPIVEAVAQRRHREWKKGSEHAIFRDFIEAERNNILKEYTFQVSEGPVAVMAHLQRNDGFDTVRQFLLEENLYRPMEGGRYGGEDGRDVVDAAIDWWIRELRLIDTEVLSRRGAGNASPML